MSWLIRTWMGGPSETLEPRWRVPRPLPTVAVLAALVAGVVGLVYATGGAQYSFVHALYLPITLAAVAFGVRGGAATALLGGLALGPLMPENLAAGVMQETAAWVSRTAFFVTAGVAMGLAVKLLRRGQMQALDAQDKLEHTQAATLKAFAAVLETYDEATGEHCERVARNARALGRELGLSATDLDQLYWAGILHDVGKVRIPTSILQKPGALTDDEYELMKGHPRFGGELLRAISEDFQQVAAGVEAHHERFDGSGYPFGLKGEEIPLFGRILAVVDSFEAMTADRPYRRGMPPATAMSEIIANAGSLYDDQVVVAYARLFREGRVEVAPTNPDAQATPLAAEVKPAAAPGIPLVN